MLPSFEIGESHVFYLTMDDAMISNAPFTTCKDMNLLMIVSQDEFRNSFFIDVHEILQSAFESIESFVIKNEWLEEITLSANMRIYIGFDQEQ